MPITKAAYYGDTLTTRTLIGIQDAYVSRVSSYSRRNRNYYSLVNRAARKMRAELVEMGFTEEQAQMAQYDAHQVACHERSMIESGDSE